MRRSRLALMSVGAVLTIVLVTAAALVWQAPARHVHTHKSALAGCTRSLVGDEWYCGKYLIHVNPDGSRVRLKVTKQIAIGVHPEAPTP